MLQKVHIHLKCSRAGILKGRGGSELHGWFFHRLAEINPTLSAEFHETVEKPFAIGSLVGKGERKNGQWWLVPGESYRFSLASLNQQTFSLLQQLLEILPASRLQLGSGEFTVEKLQQLEGTEGKSYLNLFRQSRPAGQIAFEFRSPTSFRSQGKQELFPVPELVFAGLAHRWNIFSPVTLEENLWSGMVRVTRYNLHTELVNFGNYRIIGFLGSCYYQVNPQTPEHVRIALNALASYAGFAGVGYKTTMGMGAARLINNVRG